MSQVRNVPVAETNFLLRSYGDGPGVPTSGIDLVT